MVETRSPYIFKVSLNHGVVALPISEAKTTVYGLYASGDPRVRYIGQTTKSLKHRLQEHISSAKNGASQYISRWIRKVLKHGGDVSIKPLCVDAEWNETEIGLIATAKSLGFDLTNTTNGGKGVLGYKASLEANCRRSEAEKERCRDPKRRKHLSKIAKLNWDGQERRAMLVEKSKASWTPEKGLRLDEGRKKYWTPERRAEQGKKTKELHAILYLNVEYKAKNAASIRKAQAAAAASHAIKKMNSDYYSPECIAKRSASMKKAWETRRIKEQQEEPNNG